MEEGVVVADYKQEDSQPSGSEARLRICLRCPLFIRESQVCNPGLWMNPQTMEVSHKAKAGYIKGCGCLISRKAKQKNSHCHLGLW